MYIRHETRQHCGLLFSYVGMYLGMSVQFGALLDRDAD
jgi:hypothetical protein